MAANFVASHIRQNEIQQNKIGQTALRLTNGFFAGRRRRHFVIRLDQNFFHKTEQHQTVINHQHLWPAPLLARLFRHRRVGFIRAARRFDEQMLPVQVDRLRTGRRVGNFGNRSAFPTHNLAERRHSLSAGCGRVPDLTFLKENTRLFVVRSGKFQHRGRAAHAFELDNLGELEIAKRPLEFFSCCLGRRPQETLHEFHKIPVRHRFFEEMNRAESGNLFTLLGQMNAGQNDRARVRVTRSQIVKKILAEIRDGIDIENKKLGFHAEDELLCLLQAARHFNQRTRRRFLQDI